MSHECVLVTGASSDVGAALVRQLIANGQARRIVCHYHRGEARITALAEEYGSIIAPLQADFASPTAVEEFVAALQQEAVPPTAIAHLPASKLQYERFGKCDLAAFEADWRIQVTSLMSILKGCLPRRKTDEQRRVHVALVLSSVTLGVPPKYLSMYTVIKYAQLGLMRALAAEYAELGVSVNAVSPSMIDTPLLSELPRYLIESNAKDNPSRRNVTAQEVAAAIGYLFSRAAEFVSGANIPIAGGSAF